MKVVLREEDEKAKGIPKMSHHRVRVMINGHDDGAAFAKITLLKKAKK